jgi:hypothetical protein
VVAALAAAEAPWELAVPRVTRTSLPPCVAGTVARESRELPWRQCLPFPPMPARLAPQRGGWGRRQNGAWLVPAVERAQLLLLTGLTGLEAMWLVLVLLQVVCPSPM